MSEEHQPGISTPRKRIVQLSLLVWVAMIGVDFFLHGGIFASVYLQENPFLLSGLESFRRIPFGYVALLATAGFLVWIIDQTSAKGWRKGLVLGLSIGLVMGFSSTLGLFSISTASLQLLLVWFIAQVLEMTIAGMIIGQGLLVPSLRNLTFVVMIGFILLFVGTIVMQSIGLVPTVIVR